jgi:quinolinate synthase
MKLTRLENIRNTLRDMDPADEIIIPDDIAVRARKTLDMMMAIHG